MDIIVLDIAHHDHLAYRDICMWVDLEGSTLGLSKVNGALVPGVPALALSAAFSPADSEEGRWVRDGVGFGSCGPRDGFGFVPILVISCHL